MEYGDSVRVAGWGRGIAFRFRGHPIESIEVWVGDDSGDAACQGYYEVEEREDTDRAIVVMVGDDRKHVVDMADVSPLSREDYCGECGQIGCTHDGLDRETETD